MDRMTPIMALTVSSLLRPSHLDLPQAELRLHFPLELDLFEPRLLFVRDDERLEDDPLLLGFAVFDVRDGGGSTCSRQS
jgi:hypothetical protein